MSKKIAFIGVDPGSNKLGYALVLSDNGNVMLKMSGVIVFRKKDNLGKRLVYIFDYFKKIALDYILLDFLVYFSIERQYYDKNPQSSFILVCFYSVLLLLAEQLHTKCFGIMPTQIKKIICGSGSCEKRDLYTILERQFNMSFQVFSLDESDAIAIALAGFVILELEEKKY